MSQSQLLFQRAKQVIPSGVNSPVRAFNNVGGAPLFIQKANGAYIYDVDHKEYVDYVGSWGPMILGHNHPDIQRSVVQACQLGLSYGAPTEVEIELAEKICALTPSVDKIRMVNSGTEATMSAIRVARGFTRRDKIIKFEGCYHGHADHLLVKAGSGALTSGHPSSLGVPESFSQHTIVCDFNDLISVQQAFQRYPNEIAAIIVEPVAGNMNCIPPVAGFLEGLRALCDEFKSLLIFDEVMTGFRVALGGAQALYNITPDLTCFGKIIGGGMPVGAFGGKAEIMQVLAPEGGVYQAGTLSGNPIAMHAGLACLQNLTKQDVYPYLNQITEKLTTGLTQRAAKYNIALTTHQVGGMFGLFFSAEKNITHYQQAIAVNSQLFNQFFHLMLDQGIYFAPSAFEAGFMSLAHTDLEIQKTLDAAEISFAQLKQLNSN